MVCDTKSVVVDTSAASGRPMVESKIHEIKGSYFSISREISFPSGFSPEKLLRKHLKRSPRGVIFDPTAFIEKCKARLEQEVDTKAYKEEMESCCPYKTIVQATIVGQENQVPYVMSLAFFLSQNSDKIEFNVSQNVKKVSDFSQLTSGVVTHFAVGEKREIFRYFRKHRIQPDLEAFQEQALEAFKLQSAATPQKVSLPLQMVEYRVGEKKGRWLLKPKRKRRSEELEEKPVEEGGRRM